MSSRKSQPTRAAVRAAWQKDVRKARRINRSELSRLVLEHQEAKMFGATKARVGEMGAWAALCAYVDSFGGAEAVVYALAVRGSR